MLKGKKILIGVTGSIAAYKIAHLIRILVKSEAEVRVIMTRDAIEFISPLTLATLSKNTVHTEFTNADKTNWTNHVELGMWADVFVIAPASANTIGKMANGICDNLLLAAYLSAKCPVFFAPAMDLDMFLHSSTQKNISTLSGFGNHLIDANTGELASGLSGKGRMAEPEEIIEQLNAFFSEDRIFSGKTVLITAGPTIEPIDPVRFISNHSSGKMGYAIAEAFANAGALVKLVSGPVNIKAIHPHIEVTRVSTAEEMYNASVALFKTADIAVLTAAVADFTPKNTAENKIKKAAGFHAIDLTETKDILASLGKTKSKQQVLVGFALETDNEKENAAKKLVSKNLDLIVLNSLNDTGAGFKTDTNKITILDKNNNLKSFELKAKQEVARDILNYIKNYISENA